MAQLVAIAGPSAGKHYPLEQTEYVLGRSFNCDIVIGDLNVSRRHARVSPAGNDQFWVEDLGSGNGTYVNDAPVNRHQLEATDVIRIGGTSFRFEPEQKQQWAEDVLTVMADAMDGNSLFPSTIPPVSAGSGMSSASGSIDGAAAEATKPKTSTYPPLQPLSSQPLLDLNSLTDGRAVKMLGAMFAIADAIGTELDLAKLLVTILDHLFGVFPQADRGFILLVNPATGQLVPEAVRQRRGAPGGLQYSRTMVDQVMEKGHGVIRSAPGAKPPPTTKPVADYLTDEINRFDLGDPQPLGGPKMGAPLSCREEGLGTIHLEAKPDADPFSAEDLGLLSAIARQAAVAIANARAGQALLVQQRMEDDLRLARQIQLSFLPQQVSSIQGLKFETHYVPALKVGGDFYDLIQIDPTHVGVLVGDISGKGISAALLMAKVTTDIRLLSRMYDTPAEVMTEANKLLLEAGQDGMFATVLYMAIDVEDHTFTVANAGHQPPMVASARFEGVAELDDSTAVALGVVPGMEYPQKVYRLMPEDAVLLYTDGINEAMNRQSQEYGMDRLQTCVGNGPADPARLLGRVLADLRRFVGGATQSDDQTMVVFALD